ncbi:hypothetical protein IE53DRAFT_281224 [Violaceomyces palustris]|uniref:Uncharacterized protein n=1 Tax=Violaceomyces palustris TaxID=1673888 RepID=A0ACD0NME1_9BASI|nr:hypothetical protein IE53DRAFT_281224 [Violaceomyces palustris]
MSACVNVCVFLIPFHCFLFLFLLGVTTKRGKGDCDMLVDVRYLPFLEGPTARRSTHSLKEREGKQQDKPQARDGGWRERERGTCTSLYVITHGMCCCCCCCCCCSCCSSSCRVFFRPTRSIVERKTRVREGVCTRIHVHVNRHYSLCPQAQL